ncbi:acyl-CoA dehydrogenase [Pandoraea terrae]|uniref:3-methylmercaptopropionyl-CoA dehydrogenase n=1 Tax=Pandoraea terrae TaxID=1537710 RepID=A0A5E4Z901_9BURK|nr:acyl-CoA dehydrogenase [Pandoraea terrae]VVE57791.1 acyl-CoA dehydrogenase [Pandoraea terrae]
MNQYVAPLQEMRFVLRELADLKSLLEGHPLGITTDVVDAVLDEAAKFASGVLSDTDQAGHREGSRLTPQGVVTPTGYRDAYSKFVAAGWHALPCPPDHGGQGFPRTVSSLVDEMWRASSLTLTGCVALTRGAIEALSLRASPEIRDKYLPALVEGRWTGTMNLTEPQAGSDLSGIRTKAVPAGDSTWRVFGQKIFISWGEHDMSENIVHLVLARTPDAPPGIKGISMFLVPKFLVGADGSLAERNRVTCLAIESKAGQHGSPTATLLYGGDDPDTGAIGYLVGDLHRGLDTMFVMMNEARFAVGLEGLAISERAYQTATDYARERIQGADPSGRSQERVPIIRHPDVRRMLMRMRAYTEAMRALTVRVATQIDVVHHCDERDSAARARLDLLTPIMKGWNTEAAQVVTSLGVQIHGGLGFMDECRASQHWRDARLLPIYEGTTGIQANDLVTRKIARDKGDACLSLLNDIQTTGQQLLDSEVADLKSIGEAILRAQDSVQRCVAYIVSNFDVNSQSVLAGAVPLLQLMGLTVAGWQLGRSALAAQRTVGKGDDRFESAKIATALFFAEHEMSAIPSLEKIVTTGGDSVLRLPVDQF